MISCKALLATVSSLHFILSVIGKSLATLESACAEIYFVQEKFFLTMVKDDKKGSIQEETSARGILQWGREMGLHSRYNMDKYGCVAKELGMGVSR